MNADIDRYNHRKISHLTNLRFCWVVGREREGKGRKGEEGIDSHLLGELQNTDGFGGFLKVLQILPFIFPNQGN